MPLALCAFVFAGCMNAKPKVSSDNQNNPNLPPGAQAPMKNSRKLGFASSAAKISDGSHAIKFTLGGFELAPITDGTHQARVVSTGALNVR